MTTPEQAAALAAIAAAVQAGNQQARRFTDG